MTQAADSLRILLAQLVKAALLTENGPSLEARNIAASAQSKLRSDPSGVGSVKLDGVWTLAVREAEAPDLRGAEGRVSFTFPAACPFVARELTSPDFDVDAAVERIRQSAATG